MQAAHERFRSDLSQAEGHARSTAQNIKAAFSRIGEITLGVSLGNALTAIADRARGAVVEMGKLGLEAKVQEDAFERLTRSVGVAGEELVRQLQRASGDVINTSDVMIAAARALNEGFQPQQLVRVMEIARQQSKLAGTDVTTAFNAITQAIVNQQSRALKQFGIVIDLEKVERDYAKALGVTASELTQAGTQQAVYQAVVESAARSTAVLSTEQRTQFERLQQLSSQWKQLKEDLGKILVDVGFEILDWLQTVSVTVGGQLPGQLAALTAIWSTTWRGAVATIQPVASILKDTVLPVLKLGAAAAAAFGVGVTAAFSVVAGPLAYLSSILGDLSSKKWPDHTRATKEANVAVAEARLRLAEAIEAFDRLAQGGDAATTAVTQTGKAVQDLGTNKIAGLRSQVTDTTRALEDLKKQGLKDLFASIDAEIAEYEEGLRELARQRDEQVKTEKAFIDEGLRNQFAAMDQEIEAFEEGLRVEAQLQDEAVKAARDKFHDFFSPIGDAVSTSIKGVILGTQTLDTALRNLGQNVGLSFLEAGIRRTLGAIEDALFDFLKSAAFKQFVQFAVQFGLSLFGAGGAGAQPVPAAAAGSGGAAFSASSAASIPTFAEGGIVRRPTFGLFGEAGPEAIIPLDRFSSGDVTVNFEILNQTGTPISSQMEQRTDASGIKTFRAVLRNEMNAAIDDASLDGTLGKAFGLKRRGLSR